jgi:hypothetical protein
VPVNQCGAVASLAPAADDANATIAISNTGPIARHPAACGVRAAVATRRRAHSHVARVGLRVRERVMVLFSLLDALRPSLFVMRIAKLLR